LGRLIDEASGARYVVPAAELAEALLALPASALEVPVRAAPPAPPEAPAVDLAFARAVWRQLARGHDALPKTSSLAKEAGPISGASWQSLAEALQVDSAEGLVRRLEAMSPGELS